VLAHRDPALTLFIADEPSLLSILRPPANAKDCGGDPRCAGRAELLPDRFSVPPHRVHAHPECSRNVSVRACLGEQKCDARLCRREPEAYAERLYRGRQGTDAFDEDDHSGTTTQQLWRGERRPHPVAPARR
jgi:hypothetical protein